MSSNYWDSSHRQQWQFTRDQLMQFRAELYSNTNTSTNNLPVKYDVNLRIYLHKLIIRLSKKLNLRQIIISTSEVYLNRFLIKVSINEINLYLLITTCVYLASKIEENPQHIRTILNEARNFWPEFIPNDLTKLAEFEFYLIEELNCYLVIFHPYNSLIEIFHLLNKSFKLDLNQFDLQNSWAIINDSYITDLHLLFPPHIIAITSIYLTIILNDQQQGASQQAQSQQQAQLLNQQQNQQQNQQISAAITSHQPQSANALIHPSQQQQNIMTNRINALVEFLSVSNIQLNELIESVQEILTLYESWNNSYDEILIKNSLHNFLLKV